jgi:riboflavin kinase/FMN adenylyltransferase
MKQKVNRTQPAIGYNTRKMTKDRTVPAIANPITSIAIGSFDGIHIAHRALIDQAEAVVVIERGGGYLTPGYKRSWYTDKPLFFYHLETIRHWDAAAFLARLRYDFPRLDTIVVGYDFGFGKGREGDAAHLAQIFDGKVVVVEEVMLEGVSVHSHVIGEHLRHGDIAQANAMLGRAYRIDGEVVSGQGIGARELVPTLNLHVQDYQLPAEGVYATRTHIGGQWYPSVSFFGHRITTDGTFAVETHVIDQDIGVVGGRVVIEFVAPIRPNQRFESLDALREQIERDIQDAKSMTI